jgi:hypothetical protein
MTKSKVNWSIAIPVACVVLMCVGWGWYNYKIDEYCELFPSGYTKRGIFGPWACAYTDDLGQSRLKPMGMIFWHK